MSNLILDNLEIRNFRGFRHLQIPSLGRVNLIVGKNSVGKTALLEALRLYADAGYLETIWELLRSREEISYLVPNESHRDHISGITYLFYGRKSIGYRATPSSIKIGPAKLSDNVLTVSTGTYEKKFDEKGQPTYIPADSKDYAKGAEPYLVIQFGSSSPRFFPLMSRSWTDDAMPFLDGFYYIFIPPTGLSSAKVNELWNKVVMRNPEDDVLRSLKIILPNVQRISIQQNDDRYIPIVKIASLYGPVPIRSLGDGMSRMLELALALVNVRNGLLLIDEIESGLHYSVQPDMWRLVFETARRLNVQVFATTHSWDCIEAFQLAAAADAAEGTLIRLEERKGEVIAVVADEHDLATVVRDQIEVR